MKPANPVTSFVTSQIINDIITDLRDVKLLVLR